MLSLFGYSVWIQVDDVALPEFQTNIDEATRTATCWIHSEAGKDFAILMKIERHECDSTARFVLDGSKVASRVFSPPYAPGEHKAIKSSRVGKTMERSFRFSSVISTDDETYAAQDAPQSLGEISVTTHRVRTGRETDYAVYSPHTHDIIHESSKNITAHCVSFGEPKPCTVLPTYKTVPYNPADPEPFAKFIFKYRPTEFLQANDIMPRPPRPLKRKSIKYNAGSRDSETDQEPTSQEIQNAPPAATKGSTKKLRKGKKVAKREQLEVDLTDNSFVPIEPVTPRKREMIDSDPREEVLALVGDLAAATRSAIREAKGDWSLPVDSVTGMQKAIREKLALVSLSAGKSDMAGSSMKGMKKHPENYANLKDLEQILMLVGDVAAMGRVAIREARGNWGLAEGMTGMETAIRERIAVIFSGKQEEVIDLT